MISELFNTIAAHPLSFVFAILFVFWFVSRRNLIPEEVHFVHEYTPPEENLQPRRGIYSVLQLGLPLIAAAFLLPLVIKSIPEALIWFGSIPHDVLSVAVGKLVFAQLLVVECYLGLSLMGSVWLLAEARTPPEIPRWLIALSFFLGIIAIIGGEFISLPATFWAIIFVILFSIFAILAFSWTLWASFPNNPLRVWFCRYIAPYTFTPWIYLWGTVWRCLKWGWDIWWDYEVRWFERTIVKWVKVLVDVLKRVRQAKRVVRTVTRTVRVSALRNTPNALKGVVNWIFDRVDDFVDIVEIVVDIVWVIVWITVSVFIVVPIYIVIAVAMLILLVVVKLLCLVWALIVAYVSILLLVLWVLPTLFWRLLFWN